MEPRSEQHLATDYLFGTGDARHRAAPPRIHGIRLDRQLGEGAFGVVWQGEQTEPVQRSVAVKILRSSALGSNAIRRFEAEKLALARLEHPHIAHILDAGTTADGAPYLVMEYVDGIAFDLWCHHHRDSLEQRVQMFVLVCRAIGYAHRQGILHRDLKPANVLVRTTLGGIDRGTTGVRERPSTVELARARADEQEPRVDEPKIIDFGVAKLIGFDALRTETMQRPTAATPLYMSPEIATGSAEIDGRVDVWSLGVMLFETAVGSRPFMSDRSGMAGALELQKQITGGVIPRPSDALAANAPRALKSALEDDLDWIVLRALERQPAKRYITPDALADDLERWLAGEPVLARPASRTYRFRKFARRNRAVLTLSGIAATAACIAAAALIASSVQNAREVARWKEIAAFNESMLTAIDPAVAQGLDPTLMRMVLEEAEAELERSARDPAVEAEIRMSLGNAYAATGECDNALEQYARVRNIRATEGLAATSAVMRALNNASGRTLVEAGRLEEAEPLLTAAADGDDLIAAQALHNFAALCAARAELPRAEALLREAITRKRALGAPVISTLDTEQELALVLANAGRYRDAEPVARDVLKAKLAALGARHPDTLRATNNLAEILLAQGAVAEARALLDEVTAAFAQVLGATHPDTLAALNNRAGALRESGELDEAARIYTENRAAFVSARGNEDPRAILAGANLAHCLSLLGRATEAEATFRETQANALRVLGPTHRFTLANDANYATHLVSAHRDAEAVVLLERTIPVIETELGSEHPQCIAARISLATGRLAMGQAAAAVGALGNLDALASANPSSPLVRRALEVGAKAAQAAGDTARAAQWRGILEAARRPT